MKPRPFTITTIALLTGLGVVALWPRTGPRANGPLPHDAYVWQRSWTAPVRVAVATHGSNFASLVVLHAEVSWKDGRPQTVRVPVPWEELRRAAPRVGLALRIGPFSGPFATNDAPARYLAGLAHSLLAEARSNACPIAELQLDFDGATAKLDGYRNWIETVRRRINAEATRPLHERLLSPALSSTQSGGEGENVTDGETRSADLRSGAVAESRPAGSETGTPGRTRLTLTALPSWLESPAFAPLVRAADGFVLQVHSLDPPRGPNEPFALCDPTAARRAVEQAARVGVPFRVALPTYGYLVAFDRAGRFIGLSAEGPRRTWPEGATVREVIADAAGLAALTRDWTADRPANLTGAIWYRLPVEGDARNWRWSTLAAILAGRTPRAALDVAAERKNDGLIEIVLRNTGDADYTGSVRVAARSEHSRVIASDAVNGFESRSPSGKEFMLDRTAFRFPPGESRVIGWLRLERDAEVQLELQSD